MSGARLALIEKETWIREFVIERHGQRLGQNGWKAEFLLFEQDSNDIPAATFSTANGYVEWLAPGVLRVTIPQRTTDKIEESTLAFMLRITDVSEDDVDSQGVAYVCLRGTLDNYKAASPDETRSTLRRF